LPEPDTAGRIHRFRARDPRNLALPRLSRFDLAVNLKPLPWSLVSCALVAWGCQRFTAEDSPIQEAAAASEPVPPLDPACAGKADGAAFCDGMQVRTCERGKPVTLAVCLRLERCDAATQRCVPDCPSGEVYIPATGAEGFIMGRGKHGARDKPHRVVLTQPFCLDETEVTAGAYGKCIEAGKCAEPYKWDPYSTWPRFPDQPINMVNWFKAKAFCEYLGKTLPTEAQWEWAATGGDGREWPWGAEPPTCENGLADFTPFGAPKSAPGGDVGCHGGGPSLVKAHPKGAKDWPSGKLYDLAGNVWEWTLDYAMPYPTGDQVDPVVTVVPGKPDMTVRSIRGGGWNRSGVGITTWFRGEATERYQVPGLGFRCARPGR